MNKTQRQRDKAEFSVISETINDTIYPFDHCLLNMISEVPRDFICYFLKSCMVG